MTTITSSNPLSNLANVTHTYGLSGSGVDVDSIVKGLMTSASQPYTELWQKEQQLEWKKSEYNTVYTAVQTFQNNTLFNYTMQSTLMPQTASSSVSTVATATANADAADVSHSLTVTQLATGVNETSSASITPTGNATDTLVHQFGMSSGTFNLKITNNGSSATITVDPTQSINTLVSQINNAGINVKANYDTTLDRFFLYTANTGSTATIDFTGSSSTGMDFITNKLKLVSAVGPVGTSGITSNPALSMASGYDQTSLLQNAFPSLSGSSAFNLKITNGTNTQAININPATMSLNDVINAINGAAGVNASASYNAGTGQFTLAATSGSLNFAGSDPAAMSFLTSVLNLPAVEKGQDAQFTLDGTALTEPSNNFSISSVSYSLQSTGSTTVSISPNINQIVTNVQSFVTAYNTLLSKLNTELDQPVYSDYLPLTDAQKANMQASDITAWTTKAQSGMLHGDSILQDTVNNMRENASDPVSGLSGIYNSLASIGITTGDYTQQGQLILDTNKLTAALQANPTCVYNIFGANSTSSSSSTSTQGVAVRLMATLKNSISQITTEAGTTPDTTLDATSNLAKEINYDDTRLSDMSTQLQALQTRYYNQYDAMETALQQLNSQASWITQNLG